ncbi:hypothetical protein B9Z19DRAFT_1191630 [Tuber borchii]|uniref:Uncharacterized protein n=1 Tax=Tuber borchii TaxID=42251 RepID=A0A2T6ZZ36_TUBBO|nr:hypothetical protein B9Z19DRAFT_1191630 [Tuber borchii]
MPTMSAMPAKPTLQAAKADPTPPDSSQPVGAEGPIDAGPIPSDSSQTKKPEAALDIQVYLTEGLEGVEHHEYDDIRSFKGPVNAQAKAFLNAKDDESSSPSPYLIFSHVTPHQLGTIDKIRKTQYKKVRILYLEEREVLIVKHMPRPEHEQATRTFEGIIINKIVDGGQGAEIAQMGSTTFPGTLGKKEADASLKPLRARSGRMDWPTVILECGVSGVAKRLTVDGKWWIHNSGGAVKVVLLLFVNATAKTIRIEMWKKDMTEDSEQTAEHDNEEVSGPTLQQTINITETTITGTPLVLQFRDIFLRKAKKKRGEANYFFTNEDMQEFYHSIWPPAPDASSNAQSSAEEDQSSHSSDEDVKGYVSDCLQGAGVVVTVCELVEDIKVGDHVGTVAQREFRPLRIVWLETSPCARIPYSRDSPRMALPSNSRPAKLHVPRGFKGAPLDAISLIL